MLCFGSLSLVRPLILDRHSPVSLAALKQSEKGYKWEAAMTRRMASWISSCTGINRGQTFSRAVMLQGTGLAKRQKAKALEVKDVKADESMASFCC